MSARLETEMLLQHVLQRPRVWLHTWPTYVPSVTQVTLFKAWVARRAAGEPVAYIIGQREFWSLSLAVTPATLIPRPETELLVELALARLPPGDPLHVADLGTGSGAIALAMATERPQARVVAGDICPHALAVASRNAATLKVYNIEFRLGSWLEILEIGRYDAIVANPPYIAETDPHLAALTYEPQQALVSGAQGLTALTMLAEGAWRYLKPGGWLLLEHGHDQHAAVEALLAAQSYYTPSETYRDLQGLPRVTVARRKFGD